MRDAFGGAFMIEVFLVFIMIYIGFTAMALNYAKAFKVKNTVIEYLESNEISDLSNLDLNATQMNAINAFFTEEVLGNMNYNLSSQNICNTRAADKGAILKNAEGKAYAYCHNAGVLITQSQNAENTEGVTEGVYYTVSTYIGWSIPFLNKLLAFSGGENSEEVATGLWEISGQTRLIVKG